MVNKTKPFMLVGRTGRNTIQLRYGESSADPRLFTLIVTPAYVAAKTEELWFCGCKATEGKPFCDGTHNTL